MRNEGLDFNLIEILGRLSEIPLHCADRNQALVKLTQLCKRAMRAPACELALLDLANGQISQVAFAGEDEELDHLVNSHNDDGDHLRAPCMSLNLDLLASGNVIEKYDLQTDSGILSSGFAKVHGLSSALTYPLKFEDRAIGYITQFSSQTKRFSAHQKRLLEIFARQGMVILEKFDDQSLRERSIGLFDNLLQNLVSLSPGDFLETVAQEAMALLSVEACIIWKLNEQDKIFEVAAAAGDVDPELRDMKLRHSETCFEGSLSPGEIIYIPDIAKAPELTSTEVHQRGWVSLLRAPMKVNEFLIGMFDIYTTELRYFRKWERDSFATFVHHASLSLEKAELLRKTEETTTEPLQLRKLLDIMVQITEAGDVEELLKRFFETGLELVNADRGWISLLDDKTGELDIVAPAENIPGKRKLRLGKGLTGNAILNETPLRANNVHASEWHGIYEKFWEDTQSEMAIPMLIKRASVRVGREVEFATKPIGVLNIESPTRVFTKLDEDSLLSLAYQAAIIIDNLKNQEKWMQLRTIEQKIAGERDYDQTLQTLTRGITNTLGFEYVTISWINWEQNTIRTEFVKGLSSSSKKEIEKFKELAIYPLSGDSVQAQVAESGDIVVPDPNNGQYKSPTFKRFGLDRMITVLVPMTTSTDNRRIGILEAGYQKAHGKHIYERDVHILQYFADYVVQAYELKRSGMLDKVSHEFEAPIAGIRNNASFLQRRINELPEELVNSKFNDILTDCEILLNQVHELEYLLGRASRTSKVERTMVYRDVLIKTLNQLKPLIKEQGFDSSNVVYNPAYSTRIKLYVDKAKLNQVVYNLLTNSIKYAEKDPNEFKINLEFEETWDDFIIKFQDWGIGIYDGLEERIFEEGFRTPEAHSMNVSGSGLGLTIARNSMKKIGGSLKLTNNSKPTEFQLTLPKKLERRPDDTDR